MRERKDMELSGQQMGRRWEELAERKCMIKIYGMKNIFN